MRTSKTGVELIKQFEGCELTAYLDRISDSLVWTIGYGDTQNVYPGQTITQEEADERLMRRLANEFEPGVLRAIGGAPATQAQFDAMVSLAWNIGIGAFKGSSVARWHKAGNYQKAADSFALWNQAGGAVQRGLVRRRAEEAALYLSGTPSDELTDIDADIETAVKLIQKLLGERGIDPGPVDGIPGPRTLKALGDWQAAR